MIKSITLEEANDLVLKNSQNPDFLVIDVRTPEELRGGFIGNPLNIDIYNPDFREKIGELDRQKTYLVYCRSGNRSKAALRVMEEMGFKNIYEIDRGIMG